MTISETTATYTAGKHRPVHGDHDVADTAMQAKKARWIGTARWIYWGITIPLAVTMMMAGVAFLAGYHGNVDAVVKHLGYPPYLLTILGVAKVLGGAAILYGRFETLKEWAYAGYAFDLGGAIASYGFVGDGRSMITPFILLLLVLVSHRQWKTGWM